jgi:hypothetical protein
MFEHRGLQIAAAYANEHTEECSADLRPTNHPSPEFPEYGNWQLSVIVSFFLYPNGQVVILGIPDAKWSLGGKVGIMPMDFGKAIVDAFPKWRFPPRSKPCMGSIALDFRNAL